MNIACTICLDRFFLSSTISALPCGHLFHDTCLDRWLVDERKKTCPQCRASITAKQVLKKLYLMEPLCQTQMPSGGHDSSELLQRLDAQETKYLEAEQRCRKALNDLQKCEERRQAFEKDTIALRKQVNDLTTKHQRILSERDAKINMLIEQFKHVDLSNKKDEQIKSLQLKLTEYRNIELIYKGLATTFKSELEKMLGSCQTVQDKDRLIEDLIRYNVILKEEHSKMSDDKQDLLKNLDRITAQCEKLQQEKRHAVKRQQNSSDHNKEELANVRQQLETYRSRINHLESLLHRQNSSKIAERTPIDEESSSNDLDTNMIDLTNVTETPMDNFSTQHFSNTSSAIDILHSIIQQTSNINRQKVRKLNDETEENDDYLVRPLVNNRETNFQRTFDRFGGHSIPLTRRLSRTNSFKSKSRLNNNKTKSTSTRNNHKITTFFDLN